ncbi:hypothetical protein J1614_009622 [Plenodomus biglobosus]|nr:hypothetical protein J1614_009622 [Plenodomus biglobosus]
MYDQKSEVGPAHQRIVGGGTTRLLAPGWASKWYMLLVRDKLGHGQGQPVKVLRNGTQGTIAVADEPSRCGCGARDQ